MQYSLVHTQNNQEIEDMRDLVGLSLQQNNDLPPNFETINSIDVPVNQEIPWEFTRFKSKKRVYKNPNLSEIHTKSSIEREKEKFKKNERKSRPGSSALKPGVSDIFNCSINSFNFSIFLKILIFL
jgi:hypothetical protein